MSIGSHQFLILLLQLAVLLSVALCLGRLAMRFGLPAVVGELLTGVLLGPSILGNLNGYGWLWPGDVTQWQLLDAITQLGVLLFVAVSGAHLELRTLRRRGRTVAVAGSIALVLPLLIGMATGYLLPGEALGPAGGRPAFALLMGVVMAVSAIPVIAKTFIDLKMLHRDIGQLTLVTAAGHDVVAWLLLSVVSVMTLTGFDGARVLANLGHLAVFLLAVTVVVRPAAIFALRRSAAGEGSGATITVSVVLIVGCAAASHALGFEAVLGAFVAGILLNTPGRAVTAKLAPLRTFVLAVFAPLFLSTAGLKMDLLALRDPGTLLIAALVLGLAVVGKLAGAYIGGRAGGLTHWEGLALGAGLNARGAVEIVVATIGLRLGVLSPAMYTIVVLVAVFTSLMAPPMLRWTMSRIEQCTDERLRERELAVWSDEQPPTHRARSGPAHRSDVET
ncbi:cation:proton antiporter [Allorhizocola rhizosphaerae]|uniref:cation:proton antiporter n=1 Tax=Allorhizocola rhizosphaerae TaxID=1872709 RepID=UPI000E3D60D4|nr:cation:proton antiporter [Allorhizocola rhizosphaerae]